MSSRRLEAKPRPTGVARITGTHESRLEFDGAVKEIMRQRKVMTNMQKVAREQKKEMKKIEKMERKEKKMNDAALAEKNAEKRRMLRQAQMENLRTLQGLREELKPQDFRKTTNNEQGGGMMKSLASNLIAVKKLERPNSGGPRRTATLDMGAFNRRIDSDEESENDEEDDRSVLSSVDDEGEKEEGPQIFSATLAAMKLAAGTTHYQANGQNRFNAAIAAMKLNDMSKSEDWHKQVEDKDDNDENGLDKSLDEYRSNPIPLNMRGTSGIELLNVEDLKPTYRGTKSDDMSNNESNLVPTQKKVGGGSKSDALIDAINKMNYNEDQDSYASSYEEGHEHLEPLKDVNPYSEHDFRPTPLPLNPLREDSEASLEGMIHTSEVLHKGGGQRGKYLLQGKTQSGHTNQTRSTNTMISSNDSVEVSSVSSLHQERKSKMSRLKKSLKNSFRGTTRSSGSITSSVSELSVGTSKSAKWRKRLSELTGGNIMNENPNLSPPAFVEAKGAKGQKLREMLKSDHYISQSVVSELTNQSSGRSLNRSTSRKSLGTGDECSVNSKFGEFFDDHSHARALSDALSVNSNGTQQQSIKSYYRFPTHEHPLIRVRPFDLFPNSPGWQCDSCSIETQNMRTMAYVSTDKNFIVCRQCFASLGSKIESS